MAYPDPTARPFGDIDLLAADPDGAQGALIAAGFQPMSEDERYRGQPHLPPLRPPGLPLLVEVHRAPNWPPGLTSPRTAELLDVSVPAQCGIEGILGLPPAHHAVLLAAHAWAHAPLGQLRPLLDVALVAANAEPNDLRRCARAQGVSELWNATVAALNALFGGARRSAALRMWARHLASVRERTVFEAHLTALMSPLWSRSPSQGIRVAIAALAADVRPLPEERWRDKLVRAGFAIADAGASVSVHDESTQKLARGPQDRRAHQEPRLTAGAPERSGHWESAGEVLVPSDPASGVGAGSSPTRCSDTDDG